MSGRFTAHETPLRGLFVIERKTMSDDRGFLSRLFCAEDLAAFGWQGSIAQLNETGTRQRGTVRGMHFQRPPHAEIKLVTCTRGRILDVAVDIRKESPTFLQHFAIELSEDNGKSLLIPKGFAHGFQALTDDVRMIYAHSQAYAEEVEGGLNPQDPSLAIDWPLPVINLSPRDAGHPLLAQDYRGVAA
ncbi:MULTISPECIES: dTDP-4-dehydrorhamnose 3,5-epimerase family protein [unclassified Rhizobium]|uniref:dTDP-4-dehydrorhamnose 3,5-epimerase family protein n=1 Tax=unclassified Rhizobium TaxID=2613769 RepID=UPI000715C111|nr:MULTISPECIES: dTDP-4-dehydrorhamnose 3,5-epimerase family protein [unclassified Rhizobium]KQS90800.1 dTDP-4-dehydrorhamnose 3,5-epimerase [Rhizobium sp. Leaf391]KQS95889.1 dTDP-4-dehydrorhamnose 3,5-epimerase [Rhizobium sp. Leaf386]KQU10037.1 dTDP-4-dehydrorhamnose 3,5-epimerase [Rhizobium sp. Leaf453]